MQRTTYKRPTGIGRGLLLSLVFYCAVSSAAAQTGSQPDSIISVAQTPVSFRPKPVTIRSFILPAALITTGALGTSGKFIISDPEIKEIRDRNFSMFHTSLDDYLQFAPIVAGYGMLIGNRQHSALIYTEKVVATELILGATVYATKHITNRTRPNGSSYSFPSGHTTQAFASAALFSDEFAQHKWWLSATAYAGATAVGVLRIAKNEHWASDVVAGAGFGILSAKASEWIVDSYHKKHHTKHTYTYQF